MEKFSSFNIDCVCIDGHDLAAIRAALQKPSVRTKVIVLETHKGRGVSFMEDQMHWHYLPLKEDQYLKAIAELDAA